MTPTLPFPVRFELPNPAWEAVDPASLGVQNAAFFAVRRGVDDGSGFDPTLSIAGNWLEPGVPLEQVADESLALLRAQGASDVELIKRTRIESEKSPAITQSLGALAATGGTTYDLRQAQAIWAVVDVEDPERRFALTYTLTCTYGQFETIGREFQQFMASVEIVPSA